MKKLLILILTLFLFSSIHLKGQQRDLFIGPLEPPDENRGTGSGRDALLYDQLSFGLLSYINQVFLASPGGTALAQCADDFEIPAGEVWDISAFRAYLLLNGNPLFINVYIYEDLKSVPGLHMPGMLLQSYTDIIDYELTPVGPPADELVSYDVKVNLPEALELSEGRYWVSIVPAFFGIFEGAWIESLGQPLRDLSNPYHVQDPTGFIAPFLTWTPSTLFAPPFSSYNLSFGVEGNVQDEPVAEEIPLGDWAVLIAILMIAGLLIFRKIEI
jgi:hypothetical protein